MRENKALFNLKHQSKSTQICAKKRRKKRIKKQEYIWEKKYKANYIYFVFVVV